MIAAVGDIHGVLAPLDRLLERLAAMPLRRVIFVGDYIDRGGEERLVIERLLQFAREVECVFLCGNHDDRARSILFKQGRYRHTERWIRYGGTMAVRSLVGHPVENILDVDSYIHEIPPHCLRFLEGLTTLWHQEPGYLFVHAGLRHMQSPLHQQNELAPAEAARLPEDPHAIHYGTLWVRGEFFAQQEPSMHGVVVHGHTPVHRLHEWGMQPGDPARPYFRRNAAGRLLSVDIDTGCAYGHALSALIIDGDNLTTIHETVK